MKWIIALLLGFSCFLDSNAMQIAPLAPPAKSAPSLKFTIGMDIASKIVDSQETMQKLDKIPQELKAYYDKLQMLLTRFRSFSMKNNRRFRDFKEQPNLALFLAAEMGFSEIIPDLIALGADVNATTENLIPSRTGHPQWHTPLMFAVGPLEIRRNRYNAQMVDVEATHRDSSNDQVEFMVQLIKNGARVNEKNPSNGYTALHEAASYGNWPAIKALVENGASINLIDNYGRTPLYLAVPGHCSEYQIDKYKNIIQFLLKNDADPNIRTNDGETAYDRALKMDESYRGKACKDEIVRLLKK